MENVWLVANQSFVNRLTGSVTKKQKILVPADYAKEFIAMGLARPIDEPVELSVKKSNPSQKAEEDGKDQPSASLPVETVSQKPTSARQKRGKSRKTGK